MNRGRDWIEQGERDLRFSREALEDRYFEWTSFAAQQAAEKALKGLIISRGGEPWGHALHRLLASLGGEDEVPGEILDAGRRLDRHYIPSRYPNGFAEGFPGDIYTEGEAREAVADAEAVIRFCRDRLARS